jgi:hypothetical protein
MLFPASKYHLKDWEGGGGEPKEHESNCQELITKKWIKSELGLNSLFKNPSEPCTDHGLKNVNTNCYKRPEI